MSYVIKLNVLTDGHMTAEKFSEPWDFEDMKIIKFHNDNKTYTYQYDDVEAMAETIESYYNTSEYIIVFKLDKEKTEILDFEAIEPCETDNEYYSNWYTLFNGLITFADFKKRLEA